MKSENKYIYLVIWMIVMLAIFFWRIPGQGFKTLGYQESIKEALITARVPVAEHKECMQWAFGEGIENVLLRQYPPRWNERHADIFIMHGFDNPRESLIKAGEAYYEQRQ